MYRHRRPIASVFMRSIRATNNISTDQLLMLIKLQGGLPTAGNKQASAFRSCKPTSCNETIHVVSGCGEQYDSHSTIVIQSNNHPVCANFYQKSPCHLPDHPLVILCQMHESRLSRCATLLLQFHRLPWLDPTRIADMVFCQPEIVRIIYAPENDDWVPLDCLNHEQNSITRLISFPQPEIIQLR